MKKFVFLAFIISILTFSADIPAKGDDSSFELTVALTKSMDGKRYLYNYSDATIYVILKNISGKFQRVWQENNSWGYYNLYFEITIDDKKFLVSKKPRNWEKNSPIYWIVEPDESIVFSASIASELWRGMPEIKGSSWKEVEIKAIYNSAPDKPAEEFGVWIGSVESMPMPVMLQGTK